MAIETRNGRSYYYRKRRIGRRVISEYVSGEPLAGLVAVEDEQERDYRRDRRAKFQAERERQRELDAQIDRACATVRAALAAALEVAGFHKHKGQWRKRHGNNQT